MKSFVVESELLRNRVAEKQSIKGIRVTHATKATDELPPLAACVQTLPEAVQLSLKDGLTEQTLFIFARALKAFEITSHMHLSPADLAGAFNLWWSTARTVLPQEADFDEYRFTFQDAFSRARSPLGAHHLKEAVRRADTSPPPSQARRYASARIKRLVGVCFQLQKMAGQSPFFLSVRDAARLVGTTRLAEASALLAGLVRDGLLIEVVKGTPAGRKATRYRLKLHETHAGAEPMRPSKESPK